MEVFELIEELEKRIMGFFQAGRTARRIVPPADVYESRDLFLIRLEMPGLDRDTLSVSLEGKRLVITGLKKTFRSSGDVVFHQVEIDYGEYRRIFELPGEVDAESIKATYKDGHLYIAIPKAPKIEAPKVRKITIERS